MPSCCAYVWCVETRTTASCCAYVRCVETRTTASCFAYVWCVETRTTASALMSSSQTHAMVRAFTNHLPPCFVPSRTIYRALFETCSFEILLSRLCRRTKIFISNDNVPACQPASPLALKGPLACHGSCHHEPFPNSPCHGSCHHEPFPKLKHFYILGFTGSAAYPNTNSTNAFTPTSSLLSSI